MEERRRQKANAKTTLCSVDESVVRVSIGGSVDVDYTSGGASRGNQHKSSSNKDDRNKGK